jgi:phosphoenolpyruvate carboxykinase (diphosphate)
MAAAMSSDAFSGHETTLHHRLNDTLIEGINLRLAMTGCPTFGNGAMSRLPSLAAPMFSRQQETMRLLADYLCPADWRIDHFLKDYLYDSGITIKWPARTFVLDTPGLARELSLPPDRDEFVSDIIRSYRLRQGVLHNPVNDRRTTQGVFHVAEGGLPIPDDKIAVPRKVFAGLLELALQPPPELLRLPFTSTQTAQAECFVSLLLRPVVCPAVPGFIAAKSMETRFFAPGSLVSNLDFIESIFGNAGDPFLPENDAGLDAAHWTGHTGCVILAPHLVKVSKKQLGLPHWDKATERQRRDGMCWKGEQDLYNNGGAFKLTARDERGVIITMIADNYFGYCKKEVKTQISYAANLFGLCEEEHAGGALVYPSYDLGEEFYSDKHVRWRGHSFEEVLQLSGAAMVLQPEGHAIDKLHPDIIYVPRDVHFDLQKQTVSWPCDGGARTIKLLAGKIYVRPSGYRVQMEKPSANRAWRLVGTVAEGTLCHKPCTVSGGGKSEISKSISDAIIHGPVFTADFKKDFDQVAALLQRDYSDRFKDPSKRGSDKRPLLSPERSLGSVIKLFTPSEREYSQEFQQWLNSIPQYILELIFVVKRFYKPAWGGKWREHFSVDIINGTPGNELICDNRKLVSNFLRVGYEPDGSWRVFGLRKDFHPAAKVQMEDDITASVVVPAERLPYLNPEYTNLSVKFVHNCETRLFQRPDEAIHRGYDKQAEQDLAEPGNFLSNFAPLRQEDAQALAEDAIGFVKYTEPMQRLILEAAKGGGPDFFVSSCHPRIVDGQPSKNPRYLQKRPDLVNARETYVAEMATRLQRRISLSTPVYTPVNAVVPGRRNNPPDPVSHIRSLAVFNPIHYMELPELFMELISSMTGKSPSTTGAGSEGALTKGPFNALPPIIDLNAAFVSCALTGNDVFVSCSGHIGPKVRVDHDVSLLIPEVWCRMAPDEQQPAFLIENGYFEKCADIEFDGKKVLSSRLGWRMTASFVRTFFGRVFNYPHAVFTEEILRPEKQDMAVFADGMDNIVGTHKEAALRYFADGSVAWACPPLQGLLHIMAHGQHEGRGLDDSGFRALFTRENVLASEWYAARLAAKQENDIRLWRDHADYMQSFLKKKNYAEEAHRLGIAARLEAAWDMYHKAKSPGYLAELKGTIGLQPLAALNAKVGDDARSL